jgi:hypothetical protein
MGNNLTSGIKETILHKSSHFTYKYIEIHKYTLDRKMENVYVRTVENTKEIYFRM